MRSATVLGEPIQTGTLISYSFWGVPAQDRRFGPFRARADPGHLKSYPVGPDQDRRWGGVARA
jgi:hypothetical protein